MNINEIIENYSKMAMVKLIDLVDEIDQLREDAVPHLRAELLKRGNTEEVDKIDLFFKKVDNTENLDKEIEESVKHQLEQGESIENIHASLREKGVNLVTLSDRSKEKDIIKFIIQSRTENKKEVEISVSLAEDYLLNSKEIKKIKDKVHKKGVILQIIDFVFLILFIISNNRNV